MPSFSFETPVLVDVLDRLARGVELLVPTGAVGPSTVLSGDLLRLGVVAVGRIGGLVGLRRARPAAVAVVVAVRVVAVVVVVAASGSIGRLERPAVDAGDDDDRADGTQSHRLKMRP